MTTWILSVSPSTAEQAAEKVRQRRSHLESILNVAQRLRLRCFHRLRPCWTTFLSIRFGVLLLSYQLVMLNALGNAEY